MKLTNYVTRLANMTDKEYEKCSRMARAVFLSKDRNLNIDYVISSMFDMDSPYTSSIEVDGVLQELIDIRDYNTKKFLRIHSQLFVQDAPNTASFREAYLRALYLPQVSINVRLFGRNQEFVYLHGTDYSHSTTRSSRVRDDYRILPRILKPECLVNDISIDASDLALNNKLLFKEIAQFATLTGGEINYE